MSDEKGKSSSASQPEPKIRKVSPRPAGKSPGITVRSLEDDGNGR